MEEKTYIGSLHQFWQHFIGESGKKTEQLHITSHEVYHDSLYDVDSEPLFAIPGSMKYSMWDFDYRGTFFGPSHPNNGGPPVTCNQDQSRIKISIQRARRLRTYDFCRNYFLKTFYKRNTSKSELLLSHSAEHIS